MSLIKKVDGKPRVVANKSIIDHSQLKGTEAYGCHPISAIKKLPESLYNLRTKISSLEGRTTKVEDRLDNLDLTYATDKDVRRINLEESKEIGYVTFTNYDGFSKDVEVGNPVDNNTIILSEKREITANIDKNTLSVVNGKMVAQALTTEDKDISAQEVINTRDRSLENLEKVKELETRLKGVGGYLKATDFGTPTPTQEALDAYAINQIGGITSKEEIFNQTKVKNLNDGHIWVFTNDGVSIPEWIDNGIEYINTATNRGVQGVVSGSYEEWEGFVDVLGHISINGAQEKVEKNTNNITTLRTDVDKNKDDISTLNTEVAKKVDKTYVDEQLELKANKTYVDTEIANIPKPTNTPYIVKANEWVASEAPFKFKTTLQLAREVGDNDVVTLNINNELAKLKKYQIGATNLTTKTLDLVAEKQPMEDLNIALTISKTELLAGGN